MTARKPKPRPRVVGRVAHYGVGTALISAPAGTGEGGDLLASLAVPGCSIAVERARCKLLAAWVEYGQTMLNESELALAERDGPGDGLGNRWMVLGDVARLHSRDSATIYRQVRRRGLTLHKVARNGRAALLAIRESDAVALYAKGKR